MDKAVVLLSGGIDSSTLLYYLVKEGYECYPLTINYGQRHYKEVDAAEEICLVCGLLKEWKYVDLSILGRLLPSALTGVGEMPEGHYADESMKATVVPNRNMILLAIAAGYAQGIKAKLVAYAPHMGDHPIYPDCRPVFIYAMQSAIRLGTGWGDEGIGLVTPFSNKTKAGVVSLGTQIGVPYRLTYSCYKGGIKHCGKCGTCMERKEAFKIAGVVDPTEYEE